MNARMFVLSALALSVIPLFLSAGLVVAKYPTNKNQLISWRQLEKLKMHEDIDTVILGDSSAGMAIDHAVFDELTGARSASLVLTGAFGIHGSLMMLAQARRAHPELKTAYFIFSPSTWRHDLVPEAYYLLRAGLGAEHDPLYSLPQAGMARRSYFNWLFTPRRFVWLAKDLKEPPYERGIWDERSDYIIQGPAPEMQAADKKWTVRMTSPNPERLMPVLKIWADLCAEVKCIIAHGPVYEGFARESADSLRLIDRMLADELSPYSYYESRPYVVGHDMLGDDFNHISPSQRRTATEHYAAIYSRALGR